MSRYLPYLWFFCCALVHNNAFSQTLTVAQALALEHQNGRQFSVFSPFKSTQAPQEVDQSLLTRADYLEINPLDLNILYQLKPGTITLELPFQGATLQLELFRQNITAESFNVITSDNPSVKKNIEPGVHYRGVIKGLSGSLAAISVFKDEIMGVMAHPLYGHLNLGKLALPKNRFQYVLYAANDFRVNLNTGCAAVENNDQTIGESINDRSVSGCVQVFFEADNGLYVNKGTVTATVNYVTGLFNVVSTLYQNETVSVIISQIFVWTTPDDYPVTSSLDALEAFQNTRTVFEGDIAHLITLDPGGLGGIAYVDALCSNGYEYAYSDIEPGYSNFPIYSWTIEVVTHEIGHNLGSNHTHWCGWTGGALDNCATTEGGCPAGPAPTNGGTIMSYCHLASYGINFNNGFGTQPGDKIRNEVSTAGCLNAACPSNPCGYPTSFTLTSTANTSATFSWVAGANNVSYTIRYQTYPNGALTTVNNVTSPYTLNGLSAGQKYYIELKGVCASGSSDYFVGIFFKTQSNCSDPTGQTVTNITGSSVQLNWTENAGATSWQIKYGSPGFDPNNAGTLITTSTKPYTLNGLSPGSSYHWYVRSVCVPPNSGNSGWLGPQLFTTLLSNNDVSGALLLDLDVLYDVNNAGATTQASEPNPNAIGRWGAAAGNTVWFKFVAPNSGTVTIDTDFLPQGANDDTQLALYRATNVSNFSTFTLLVSDDDNGIEGNSYNAICSYSGLTPGETVYIQADGYGSVAGNFQIMVSETVELANLNSTCTSFQTAAVNGVSNPNRWWSLYTTSSGISIGQLVGAIKTPQNLGTVTLKARSGAAGGAGANVYYMGRYYDISSSTAPTLPVSVRMFYTDADLSALQAAIPGQPPLTIDNLDALHYDGPNEDCIYTNNGANTYTTIQTAVATRVGVSDRFYLEYNVNSFSELLGIVNTTIFPLELTQFYARAEAGFNQVFWQTAAEQDLAFHVIERSYDGLGHWTELGRLPASVNSQESHHYEMLDKQPFPSTYYRLKSIDRDGTAHFSSVVKAEQANSRLQIVSLYPVPAEQYIQLVYQAATEHDIQISILDISGKQLRQTQQSAQKGLNQESLDISSLPAGVYFLELHSAEWPAARQRFLKK
jgi:hypothetical protein